MATITCKQLVKDSKSGLMRPCKTAPAKGSDLCGRHGGKAVAPVTNAPPPAVANAPAAQPPAQAAVGQQCTAMVKKTNLRCTNKPKIGTLCGMHGPKAAKTVPTSTDGSGYPTACTKQTGKSTGCKNTAYGPDNAGAPSCFRHGGPTKAPANSTASGGTVGASGGGNNKITPLADVPLVHLSSVIFEQLQEALKPEVFAANEEQGYTAEFESALWMINFLKLFDGKSPSDDELSHQLGSLAVTSEGEDFWEHFADEEGNAHSMMHYITELFGKASVEWLVNYIRRLSNSSDELKVFWDQIKEEMGYSDVLAPVEVAQNAPPSAAASQEKFKNFQQKAMDKIMGKIKQQQAPAEPDAAAKKEDAGEELLA